jgi:hypothetical protein
MVITGGDSAAQKRHCHVFVSAPDIEYESPSLGNAGWQSGWSDISVRSKLHWVEAGLLALSAFLALRAVLIGFTLYSAFSLYLPDMEAKMCFLTQKYTVLSNAWAYSVFSLVAMLTALPFVAARVSPVSTVTTGACTLLCFWAFWTEGVTSIGDPCAAAQHAEGRRLLVRASEVERLSWQVKSKPDASGSSGGSDAATATEAWGAQ